MFSFPRKRKAVLLYQDELSAYVNEWQKRLVALESEVAEIKGILSEFNGKKERSAEFTASS